VSSVTNTAVSNPFPGLRPFLEEEEYLFFGRENQVDAMVDKLAATRFLAVVGTSGSGKSSLVNCGLRPALHGGLMARAGTTWRMAQFRPGSDPLREMARALAEDGVLFNDHRAGATRTEIIDTNLRISKRGLVDIVEQARLAESVNLLVIVDQFEELFRYRQLGADDERESDGMSQEANAFVNLLLEAAAQPECPIYVALTMRSDFLGDCAQFPGLAEAINAGQYLVPRMTRDERRAAIKRPVSVGGAEISPVLLTRLVNDVGDNPDQLSILQHALNRTWAYWKNEGGGEGSLDLAHYEAIGSMAHALDQHADKAYDELATERQQQICEKIFKAITDKATDRRGIRRPTPMGTLCALIDATATEVTEVIDVFRKPSRSFLMPQAGKALEADAFIDISHESLMRVWKKLGRWADEEARSAGIFRRLAETAVLHEKGQAGLWRDPDLQGALDWRDHSQPNETWAARYHPGFAAAMRFLEKSRVARETEQAERETRHQRELEAEQEKEKAEAQSRFARRMRWVAVIGIMLAVAASGFGYYAFDQKQVADEQKTAAEKEKAVADKERSIADKERTMAEKARLKAQINLVSANVERARSAADKGDSIGTLFSLLNAYDEAAVDDRRRGSALRLIGARAQRLGIPLHHERPVTSASFSSDGKRILTVSEDETARLWDVESRSEIIVSRASWQRISLADFGLGKSFKLTVSDDNNVRISGMTKSRCNNLSSMEGSKIARDRQRALTVGRDNTVRIRDGEKGKVITVLEVTSDKIISAAFSPDGKHVLVTTLPEGWCSKARPLGGTVRIWALDNRLPVTCPSFAQAISSPVFDPGGNLRNRLIRRPYFVAASPVGLDGKRNSPGLVSTRNWRWGEQTSGKDCLTGTALRLTDGSLPISSGGARTGKWPPVNDNTRVLARSPDGRRAVTWSKGREPMRLWDRNKKQPKILEDARGNSVAFSPDGKLVVIEDIYAHLWDAESGLRLSVGKYSFDEKNKEKPADYIEVRLLGASLDRTRILTEGFSEKWGKSHGAKWGARTGYAQFWAAKTGKHLRSFDVEQVSEAAFSPDGKRIVTAGGSPPDWPSFPPKVWDVATGKSIKLEGKAGHAQITVDTAYSPEGRRIATTSTDGTTRLWDPQTGLVTAISEISPGVWPNDVVFSPDGTLTLSSTRLWFARLSDAETGLTVDDFWTSSDWSEAIAFSQDGTRVAVQAGYEAENTPAQVWLLAPPACENSKWLRLSVEVRTGHAWDNKIGRTYALTYNELIEKKKLLDKDYKGKFCDARKWEDLSPEELAMLRGTVK